MSLPYLPLFIDDYEAATAHLTMVEDGAYNRLLRLCWRSPGCKLPNDEAWIMRKMRATTEAECDAVRSVLNEFFTKGRGKIWSKRLLEVHLQKSVAHTGRVEAGKKGGTAKALKTNNSSYSNATALPEQCSSNQNQNQEEKEEANASSKKPASRLPPDWRLPATWGEWAMSEGMAEPMVRQEAAKFHDYWKGVPGSKGVKLDWLATWRNWVRKALADLAAQSKRGRQSSGPEVGEIREFGGTRKQYCGNGTGWLVIHD